MNIFEKVKYIKLSRILVVIPILAIISLFVTNPIYAANKTSIEFTLSYIANEQGELKNTYTTKYTNNTPNTILTFENYGTFSLEPQKKYLTDVLMWNNLDKELESLVVKINNSKVNFTSSKTSTGYDIQYRQNYSIRYKESLSVSWEYTNPELIEKVGRIYNVYIPESPEFDPDLKNKYDVKINSKGTISKDLGPIYFETLNHTESGNNYVYNFESKDASKKSHVIQLGNSQIWSFELVDPINLSGLSYPNLSEYTLMLPSDDATLNQKVFFESFEPLPQKITRLPNGNLEATYYLDESIKRISVKGYLEQSEEKYPRNSFESENIDLTKYLDAEKYWEVTDPLIVSTANDIQSGASTNETIMNVYDFVIKEVDYDKLKLGIDNIRQGAVNTLISGSGVCMEYSDLLITLLRAKGIPSRAVFGYGYTPGGGVGETEKHQWVQAYIEGTGWVSIDPTWGSTTRKFIGKDFDHFSWFVSEESVEKPEEVTQMGINNLSDNLVTPDIYILPKEDTLDTTILSTAEDVVNKYKISSTDEVILKLRVLIYLPYFVTSIAIGIFLLIITRIIRGTRRAVLS